MTGDSIGVLSPSGWGNLGDAAILASLVAAVERRRPGAKVVGFTLHPANTSAEHGIEAATCIGYSLPHFAVAEPWAVDDLDATGVASADTPASPGLVHRISERLPGRRALRWAAVPARLRHEPAHLRRSRARLEELDLFVVAGGGQLDSTWGGPLGQPYALWRWSRLARAAKVPYVVLSVGTGTLGSCSRRLVRSALQGASYRSFRDARSIELLAMPDVVGADTVVPDLAYAVPIEREERAPRSRHVIGISPMGYGHPVHWPRADRRGYRRLVATLAHLTRGMVSQGHEVVVFTTDADQPAVDDLVALVGELPVQQRHRFRVADTGTLADLLALLASVDAVVAARLHGVILAHVAHRPVLAVAHERKVRQAMVDAGQDRFVVDLADLDPDDVTRRLEELLHDREAQTAVIARQVEGFRDRVERQYDDVLGSRLCPT